MDKLEILSLVTQKGANAGVVAIAIKLLLFDADLTTEIGVKVAVIGAFLLAVAAVIEYMMWRHKTNILFGLNKESQKMLVKHLFEEK